MYPRSTVFCWSAKVVIAVSGGRFLVGIARIGGSRFRRVWGWGTLLWLGMHLAPLWRRRREGDCRDLLERAWRWMIVMIGPRIFRMNNVDNTPIGWHCRNWCPHTSFFKGIRSYAFSTTSCFPFRSFMNICFAFWGAIRNGLSSSSRLTRGLWLFWRKFGIIALYLPRDYWIETHIRRSVWENWSSIQIHALLLHYWKWPLAVYWRMWILARNCSRLILRFFQQDSGPCLTCELCRI